MNKKSSINKNIKKSGIKLCFISCFPPSRGRLAEHSFNLIKELKKLPKIEHIDILANKEILEQGSSIEIFEKMSVYRVWTAKNLLTLFLLPFKILSLKPDIIHFNVHLAIFGRSKFANFLGLCIPFLCRLLGFKTVVTLHNMIERIKIKKTHPKAIVPKPATKDSACFDLYCCEGFSLSNGYFHQAKTGLVFEIPKGYHVAVYPRSGMSRRGIIISNSPGIIDADYRGEVMVSLYGLFMKGREIFQIGSRVAQCRLVRNETTQFQVVNKLSETERGSGGFGSTGK